MAVQMSRMLTCQDFRGTHEGNLDKTETKDMMAILEEGVLRLLSRVSYQQVKIYYIVDPRCDVPLYPRTQHKFIYCSQAASLPRTGVITALGNSHG
jgi:hypothetical protein